MHANVVANTSQGAPAPAAHGEWTAEAARHLRAIILLAGSVRPSELGRGVQRSLLDLPIAAGTSVLSVWQANAADLARAIGVESLPVRVILNQSAIEPALPPPVDNVKLGLERDAAEFRGTGGILRDLVRAYDPDDMVLVGNGAQVLVEPLPQLAEVLLRSGACVAIVAHDDGTPSGLFLVKCSVLESAGDIGFLDFKEQLLPRLAAAGHDIRVIGREHATGHPVRTLDGYLAGLRSFHRARQGLPLSESAFEEDWMPTFSIIETAADVVPGATVHDSVVLAGAQVGRGAAVVRCVICPDAVVPAGQLVADRVITTGRERTGARGRR
jgi:hypothetical protein